ncbi:MAG: response regulator [Gemmatimonadota bacterium]
MDVLLVDDDAEIRLIAALVLGSAGHSVREAASFEEARACILHAVPDLVLMDVMLGDEDGVVAAVRLLEPLDARRPPLIFLTGAVRPEQTARMMRAGAAGIVHKPFDPATLVARLTTILGEET